MEEDIYKKLKMLTEKQESFNKLCVETIQMQQAYIEKLEVILDEFIALLQKTASEHNKDLTIQ